jgi:hypothetical protein
MSHWETAYDRGGGSAAGPCDEPPAVRQLR